MPDQTNERSGKAVSPVDDLIEQIATQVEEQADEWLQQQFAQLQILADKYRNAGIFGRTAIYNMWQIMSQRPAEWGEITRQLLKQQWASIVEVEEEDDVIVVASVTSSKQSAALPGEVQANEQ